MEAAKFVPQDTATQESKLHFLDYWRIIQVRKTVIIAVFLLVVITTTVVTYILPKTYMSTAQIEVQKDLSDIPLLLQGQQQSSYDPYFIRTEFEKIRGQRVLYPVIEELSLSETLSKRYRLTSKLSQEDTFQIIKKTIDLQETRNTSLIEIRAYSEDPNEASAIANKVAEIYQRVRLENRKSSTQRGIDALRLEFTERSKTVEKLQQKVDGLRKDLGVSDVGDSSQVTLEPETMRMFERDRVNAKQMFAQTKTLHDELSGMTRPELRRVIPVSAPDEALNTHLRDLAKIEQQLAQSRKDYSDEHPEIQKLTAVAAKLNQQIEERIEGVLRGVQVTMNRSKSVLDELEKAVADSKKQDGIKMENYRPYFAAKRDLETENKIRETIFLRILQETVDDKIPKNGMVDIVNRAKPDETAVRPNVPLNITLGVIFGLIVGFGLAFFIEYLDTSVKTIDDVERALHSAVLGVIPQNVGSLLEEGPDSPHAEAYRVLRTNMLFGRTDPKANTITVVSGGAGEGKSTTIFNLAVVFAQNGSRVLLVDSDLRRPSLHKILNLSNSIGLTNYLLKQNTLEEVVQRTPVPTLDFLPSGKLPSSSLGVLSSAQMREFIGIAKERYDFVFFDSPPIMGVSDASILCSEVDIALLVIQYRKYPEVMTVRAKQMVDKVGGNLIGVVLNNINISQDSYYYYYSGYYYDYYSKHDGGDKYGDKYGDSYEGSKKKKKKGSEKPTEVAETTVKIEQKF